MESANEAAARNEAPDLLMGVLAIAEFMGVKKRQAQHQIDEGRWPTFRMGKVICARRSSLREWLAKAEAAQARGG